MTIDYERPPRLPHRVRFVQDRDKVILEEWRRGNNRRLWAKAVVVLENRNLPLPELAKKVEEPESRLRQWIDDFNCGGIEAIEGRRKRSPRRDARVRALAAQPASTVNGGSDDIRVQSLVELLHDQPRSWGIGRSNWNLRALALAFEKKHGIRYSTSSIWRIVKKSGYRLRKARRVLMSPDPQYREKVDRLLQTLRNLGSNELFFFVDELGPVRVKKYGGRIFTKPGAQNTYPQVQPSKGSVTLAGALSATTNQVAWLYGPSKDTRAMIDLLEILFNRHQVAPRIFVTWDAASWHSSALLIDWVDQFNQQTRMEGVGPIIELVPLPRSAQFLNVIEAIFSGMKRAVVHGSDYRTTRDMKTAISRHFVERNAFFAENPRRAGKKIWEVDFFSDYENIRSGNYREY